MSKISGDSSVKPVEFINYLTNWLGASYPKLNLTENPKSKYDEKLGVSIANFHVYDTIFIYRRSGVKKSGTHWRPYFFRMTTKLFHYAVLLFLLKKKITKKCGQTVFFLSPPLPVLGNQ